MSANTVHQNRATPTFEGQREFWLFGYGSLIFKADFEFTARRVARISGWSRRFWQGSHDHRGTEDRPGRVVTLIREPGAVCTGIAYRVNRSLLDHLDYREKNGYLRRTVAMRFDDDRQAQGLIYIATAENAAYLGPATEPEIAAHVAGCTGPSGRNDDYVLELARALRAMSAHDPHVFSIERLLQRGREVSPDA